MGRPSQFSPEARERAVRMVREHEHEYRSRWEAIRSMAPKIGCTAQSLHNWIRKTEPVRVHCSAERGIHTDPRAVRIQSRAPGGPYVVVNNILGRGGL